ncbi:unnamed protein product, partial [Prorocentrum cordatum]
VPEVPAYRGDAEDPEIGDFNYALILQEKNIKQCQKMTQDVKKKYETQIDYLTAQKRKLNSILLRSHMLNTRSTLEAIIFGEIMQTITDQLKGIEEALTATLQAHGSLQFRSEPPPKYPSSKEYMKKQVDEINHLEDQATLIRTQRAMELAKITLGIPAWDKGGPSTWVFYGWKEQRPWVNHQKGQGSESESQVNAEEIAITSDGEGEI